MYDHFKKYSGVLVYFKTSRCKLQPWPQVLEKIPHFSNAALLPSVASIIPTLNRDAEEISGGGGGNSHQNLSAFLAQKGRVFRGSKLKRGWGGVFGGGGGLILTKPIRLCGANRVVISGLLI